MTPLFCWVFLLALVGRAASVPAPLVNDACALVCNPGAETEGERERRERDPIQYPRYPKGTCKLQSSSDQDQARVIVSHCLKLCANELSDASELNCFVLRSSIESHLGCYCPALVPLSPNTMRLHENWRITHLVNELAQDLLTVIFPSPIEQGVICELYEEVFTEDVSVAGLIADKCQYKSEEEEEDARRIKRSADDGSFMDKVRTAIHEKENENVAEKLEKKEASEKPQEEETEDHKIRLSSYGEHMNFHEFCQKSCRSNKPDIQCDCENVELDEKDLDLD